MEGDGAGVVWVEGLAGAEDGEGDGGEFAHEGSDDAGGLFGGFEESVGKVVKRAGFAAHEAEGRHEEEGAQASPALFAETGASVDGGAALVFARGESGVGAQAAGSGKAVERGKLGEQEHGGE